ncbi:peroxiredoxin-like family protein [Streptomyces sp. H39-S7]|uniref:peroxiredoxin-like family protein n=1 Tax=Streptomyces sp. H39-S7 TaxID=3004357 RepID=UPI0022B07F16|nr:peroxiredoxin-like family protein [Streptomyces sp. H39-S7]MCZ4123714.1 peroxiredoxin-like family protein [Streptomyces sp. H39-S7]
MSLQNELRDLYENGHRKLPADALEVMDRGGVELAASGLADRALGPGAQAPRFTLPAADGRRIALDGLLAEGPVVLTFYRGAWCPYCNLALRSLQLRHDDITARGARLVAVSPQIPDESLSLTGKEQLAFDVLSDIGSEVAQRFGIAFDLSGELGAVYDRFGFELQRVNGGHARTLPLPATYVIDRSGVIRWAFVRADYTLRAEPADILAALDALN